MNECSQIQGSLSLETDKVILSQAKGHSMINLEGAETGCSESYEMDYNVSSKVEQRGILAGMLLGVGRRNLNNFFIQHTAKQERYLLFKKKFLNKLLASP